MTSLVDYQSSSDESETDQKATSLDNSDGNIEPKSYTYPKSVKTKEPVKITIPSLSQYEDDDDHTPTKKPKRKAGSGLLSLLPAPKFSSTKEVGRKLIPHIISKAKDADVNTNSTISGNSKNLPKPVSTQHSSHSDCSTSVKAGDEEMGNDFFALENISKASAVNNALPFDSSDTFPSSTITLPLQKVYDILPPASTSEDNSMINNFSTAAQSSSYSRYNKLHTVEDSAATEADISYNPRNDVESSHLSADPVNTGSTSSSTAEDNFLEDERFLRLQGKKCDLDEINIIDVSVDSKLAPKTEWFTKSITEEKKVTHSRRKDGLPTQQQKRKHQITYLAFQAKERELDLKNQWAQSRHVRKQNHAKYGF